jgi:hypothetical protein
MFNSLVPQKAIAGDDCLDEIQEAFILAGQFLADLVDARAVAAVQLAADGVGEKFLGETEGEGVENRGALNVGQCTGGAAKGFGLNAETLQHDR